MPSSKNEDIFSKPYQPIDTDVVDNIEHYASDHIHVTISYRDRDATKKELRGFIADVYTTENHEEYLKMVDGRTLRLDQLIEVTPKLNGPDSTKDRGSDLKERLNISGSRFFPETY